ncbi:unnamed protein product [Didymodactylos carnosus]|uniref:RING-type domain-containing protein n=1 Tax=Didymodactylos carnosus TaxID=1234261 RepID=A0A8S2D5R5_9BILA|nr:unnamed protein product [Didymodactylos carnosus]CAF3604327.1 unnamed protein product [Didymodactylos carnosus]
MAENEECPSCDGLYGNDLRRLPCKCVMCHKCAMNNFENGKLKCLTCYALHSYSSKNTLKKNLISIGNKNHGKKVPKPVSLFTSTMPIEKPEEGAAAASPTKETATIAKEPVETTSPALVSTLTSKPEIKSERLSQQPITSVPSKPSALTDLTELPTTVQAPVVRKPQIARCSSCLNKTELIICEHCDHFICLKCADDHRNKAELLSKNLIEQWKLCKEKYEIFIQTTNDYDHERIKIENQLMVIRDQINQRTDDAIKLVKNQHQTLLELVDNSQSKPVKLTKHTDIEQDGDTGTYKTQDFLLELDHLEKTLDERATLTKIYTLKVPVLNKPENISIAKLFGKLSFESKTVINNNNDQNDKLTVMANTTTSKMSSNSTLSTSSNPLSTVSKTASVMINKERLPSPQRQQDTSSDEIFADFLKMKAQIHQSWNTPYNKIVDTAPTSTSQDMKVSLDKRLRSVPLFPSVPVPLTLTHSLPYPAVPHYLCVIGKPLPLLFVCDKYGCIGKYSLSKGVKPKTKGQFPFYLFSKVHDNNTEHIIESFTISTRYIIVYTRDKDETTSGKIYFFTYDGEYKDGIRQNIAVHHILADSYTNRLWCLDRMRFRLYYYVLPTSADEIVKCLTSENNVVLKIDEKVSTGNGQSETINRRQKTEMLDHIVLEVNRKTKQIISEKKGISRKDQLSNYNVFISK